MNSTKLVLAAALVAIALPAQNVVIPAVANGVDGNDSRSYPFGRTTFRMQQVIDAAAVSASPKSIVTIAYRPDNGNSIGSQAVSFPNVEIRMSHTSVTPATLSTTYASNITGAVTLVYSGAVSLNAYTSGPLGVAAFDPITLQNAFPFDPALGNLLIDIVAIDPVSASTSYFPDTARPAGPWEVYGQSGAFSAPQLDWPKHTVNGSITGGQGNMAGIGIGGQVTYIISSGSPLGGGFPYSGFLLFGALRHNPPIDLTAVGAPGNFLYVDSFAATPFTLMQGPIGGPSWNLPIPVPNTPALFRSQLHTQPIYMDSPANTLGWVAGGAIRITLGDSLTPHPTNQVSGNSATAATGSLVFGSTIQGAAVVRLGLQ
jgi:hypothetical protein